MVRTRGFQRMGFASARSVRTVVKACRLLAIALPLSTLGFAESVDLGAVHRIRGEAFTNSSIPDYLFHVVEVFGTRLTGSPGFKKAADFSEKRMQEWGLANVRQEPWGPFGRSWSYSRFSAHLIEPQYETLIGVPMAWSPSTSGAVSGTPVIAVLKRSPTLRRDEEAVAKFIEANKGKLAGAIVLIEAPRDPGVIDAPLFARFSDAQLAEREQAQVAGRPIDYEDPDLEVPADPKARSDFSAQAPAWFRHFDREGKRRVQNLLNKFLTAEGVRLVIHPGFTGSGGTVFPPNPPHAGACSGAAGSRHPEDPIPPPTIALTPEHYNRLFRLVANGIRPRIEVEVEASFHTEGVHAVNVTGELPGGSKKDEVVMIGAHLDSVGAGLGATDNAAGCAVTMEAMRILRALKLPLNRTVRIALWGGEEEGFMGSTAYVRQRFGEPETMTLRGEHAKLSAYFNLDNGTGKIRGVYLQGNDMSRPIFAAWLEPFRDLGAGSLTIRNTGGTDHLPFNAVGLPAFQFIQDPAEYETRSHHSNMDLYDRIQLADLKQAAAIVAAFAYHAANRDEMLPRKPLPPPQPKERPRRHAGEAASGSGE
ncbi:MAG: M20/M25/M40 family metallo-hydrolase [Bryobacteraceae bacterium]|nr:M20/M25/M40 family metallo-hydrolase [Bryobacteraceae bacterium]